MRTRHFLTFIVALLSAKVAAQSVAPTASYLEDEKTTEKWENISGQAPLDVTFRANPSKMEGHTAAYEWHIKRKEATTDLVVHYEEDTSYRFLESGTFVVTLKTRLTDNDSELDEKSIEVTISESRLEMPNAFSPNGDQINEYYAAKGAKINPGHSTDGYKSIVEFHAYIFNRWGQKLYEWTDIDGGWDGTYKGSPVKEGVYFVLVKARGADGREYNIKKDVNLLRGYIKGTSTNSSTGN